MITGGDEQKEVGYKVLRFKRKIQIRERNFRNKTHRAVVNTGFGKNPQGRAFIERKNLKTGPGDH